MKLVALISGGKDSCYNMLQCVASGHEIVALAHLKPNNEIEELDSFMYQSVGHNAVEYFAKAMDLPLYQEEIGGVHVCSGKDYTETTGDEVEDLYFLLQKVKENETVEGVASGAILSDYQRVRVENVCSRLGLTSFAYLWRRNQTELVSEMIASGIIAVVIKVATLGLVPELHLDKRVSELLPHFLKMEKQFGMNVCGEGGEYETFTLDCPLFKETLVIDEQVTVNHALDAFAPVAYLKFNKLHLEPKSRPISLSQREAIDEHGICRPGYFLYGLGIDCEAPFVPDTILHSGDSTCSILRSKVTFREKCPHVTVCDSGWFWINECVAEQLSDVAEEMRLALQSVEKALAVHGLTMSSLVSVLLMVRDMQEFVALNKVYKTYFNTNPPSRVCVQVPLPDTINFVMHCIGFNPSEQHCSDDETVIKHMHVQSVSHWAPANIGPYSQAVQVGNFIFVSGQIGLIPSTMVMIGGGIVPESRLSLRHVQRVLEAMSANCTLSNVLYCVCYVTHHKLIASAREEWNKAVSKTVEDNDMTMTCVVVPALPRGACVEWQVVAHCEQPQSLVWTKFDMLIIDDISIKCILGQLNSERVLIARCLYIDNTHVVKENTVAKILAHLMDIMTVSVDDKAASQLQVYYSVSEIDWDTIMNAWKNLNFTNSGLSLIPVLNMETSGCVLSIFGRYQSYCQ